MIKTIWSWLFRKRYPLRAKKVIIRPAKVEEVLEILSSDPVLGFDETVIVNYIVHDEIARYDYYLDMDSPGRYAWQFWKRG